MYISFLDHYLIKSFLKINVKWVLENGKTYSKINTHNLYTSNNQAIKIK